MPSRFVVQIHYVRLRKLVDLVFYEVIDGFQVWERFHAEFAVEPPSQLPEDLVFLLRPMPHYTIVNNCQMP